MSAAAPDPVALAQALVRLPSVTPDAGDAIALLERTLAPFGFGLHRPDRGGVANLYARLGSSGPVFGYGGHVDVVPVGDPSEWSRDPFSGALEDGMLHGRGATDMKSSVAAFVSAACAAAAAGEIRGSLALLITGDEEGPAEHGTRAILDWMAETDERLDVCLVGEPTSAATLGDAMKIGRRGSLNAQIRAEGRSGHVAYPDQALNPLPALTALLTRLAEAELDAGTAHFQPSRLALTSVDVGNAVTNVIPGEATARLNIRFNDGHTGKSLAAWLCGECRRAERESGVRFVLKTRISGEAFLTEPGAFTELIATAAEAETGLRPTLGAGGGTSDARFIKDHCPVVEFGLTGRTMHAVDERVSVAEIQTLTAIYRGILQGFFAARP
ncbi:MAG: succinyl-diaminopimelate desuccinylase [Pseudomonadota bacterium]